MELLIALGRDSVVAYQNDASAKIKPQPMVTDVIAVDQVPEMFQALKRPGARAKVLVEFPH